MALVPPALEMLPTKLTYFGQTCWLVARRIHQDFAQTHPDCVERDIREAQWMLREVDPAGLLRSLDDLHSRWSHGVAKDRALALEHLCRALETGALRFYVEPRTVRLEPPQVQDLLPEDYEPAVELPRHWIEVRVVDEDEQPRDGERYHVVLADGTELSGRLDRNGVTRIPDVPGGPSRWSFPELHPDQWDMAS